MGTAVNNHIFFKMTGQIFVGAVAVKGKLHQLHTRIAAFFQKAAHLRGNYPQILCDDFCAGQSGADRLQQLFPGPVSQRPFMAVSSPAGIA